MKKGLVEDGFKLIKKKKSIDKSTTDLKSSTKLIEVK